MSDRGVRGLAFPAWTAVAVLMAACAAIDATLPGVRVDGDGIPAPLEGLTGDAARGRSLIVVRDPANCVLCHAVPDAAVVAAGNLGPSLDGAGRRLTVAELRLRVVDQQRINAQTVMPSYFRIAGLSNVAPEYRGKPVLSAQAVEDIVAWLAMLQ
jgi:L-cysteine S-thiosulfotransferase